MTKTGETIVVGKHAGGIWDAPGDPRVYGFETYPVENMLDYLDELESKSNLKITPTTFVMKAISRIFEKYHDLNSLVIGSKVYQRTTNDIFCLVATVADRPSEAELSGVELIDVDEMTFLDIALPLKNRAKKVRDRKDAEIEKTRLLIEYAPSFMLSFMVNLIDFLTYSNSRDLDSLGIQSDPFGSAMVTSVGQSGLKQGFAPLVRSSHCPMLIVPGQIHETSFAEDGQPVVKKGMTVSCAFDHRVYDGYQIGYMARLFRSMITEPREHFPLEDQLEWKGFLMIFGSTLIGFQFC